MVESCYKMKVGMGSKTQKLLVLGGKPIASCDIVSYAKSIGIYTIVTDFLPISESPAKRIADEAWNVSTADVGELCRRIHEENVSAVFTGVHEFNIDKTLEVCQRVHFPFYASREQLYIMSHKDVYKDLFSRYGMPKIKECYSGKAGKLDVNGINCPVIVKPVDGSSGLGVKICRSKEELQTNAANAVSVSKSSSIIVEEYIESPEVTIFYIIQNGKFYLSAIADRQTYKFKEGTIALPVFYAFPSKHIEDFKERYNERIIAALASIGLQNGMVFIQAFWKDGLCLIYDVGYRLTGTQEYNLLSEICGFNPLEMLVDYALTGKMGEVDVSAKVDPFFHGKHAGIITFLMKPGKIGYVGGMEQIEKESGVVKFVLNHEEGESVPIAAEGTLNQVVGRAYVITDTKEELEHVREEVQKKFEVRNDVGENILIN